MKSTRRHFLASVGLGTACTAACGGARGAVRAAVHVVLLGDSIFDNGRYVPGKPCVIEQMTAELGDRGRATLLAVDGDVARDVAAQLERLPADATHLAVSVGGNDALRHAGLLEMPVQNAAELLVALALAQDGFRADYRRMLEGVKKSGKPVVVCTIYDSNFEAPRKRLADVALAVFNDVIVREASEAGVPVVDLRRIFRERKDYANAIEPSETGGAKVVKAIARALGEHDFARDRTTLYA